MSQFQSSAITFTTFIYIQLLYVVDSQYDDIIWSDNFSSRDSAWSCGNGNTWSSATTGADVDWSTSTDACFIPFQSTSGNCDVGNCALLCSVCQDCSSGGDADFWFERTTNIPSYSAIMIKFDVTAYELGAGETCQIWYKYDTGNLVNPWTGTGINTENIPYRDQVENLGGFVPNSATTVRIYTI
eukprot:406613_1